MLIKVLSKLSIFHELDECFQAPHSLLRQPVTAIVEYLNKRCHSDLDKVRAYFRWLCTRDRSALIDLDPELDADDAVLKILREPGSPTDLFADMCRFVILLL